MITHFKGNRSPSMHDTISVNGVPFNLTGTTVKFKMRSESSSTLKVDAAATVDSPTAGTVHYDWQAVDVDTAGRFLFWWEVTISAGVTQDTPESLISFIEHAPVSRALCTLEDVQAYIPGYIPFSDEATDTVLTELIASVSTEMHNNTNREFQPVTTNPSTRTFDLSLYDAKERKLYVGDLKDTSGLSVSITELDGTAVATLTAPTAAMVALPRNRAEWEPYNYLWFPEGISNSPNLSEDFVVAVTGNWGFQTIPADIRTACVKLVIVRYLRDVASGGTAFADAIVDAAFDLSSAFASANDTIESYAYAVIA